MADASSRISSPWSARLSGFRIIRSNAWRRGRGKNARGFSPVPGSRSRKGLHLLCCTKYSANMKSQHATVQIRTVEKQQMVDITGKVADAINTFGLRDGII